MQYQKLFKNRSVAKIKRGAVMKKIFLYAYDHINLGDDLFIETIVKRYPNTLFYFWTDGKNKTVFHTLNNLRIIDQNSWKVNVLNKIRPSLVARYKARIQKKCNVQVYIGGSIFIEYPTWKDIVAWWEYQSTQYPFFVLGANFGPYHTEEYKNAMDKVYKQLKDVCFRDSYSKRLFAENDNVRKASDILFSYQMPQCIEIKKQIFVSVISYKDKQLNTDFNKMTNDEYLEKMSQMITGFIRQGYHIVLASFCREEGDLDAAKDISKRIAEKQSVKILDYDGLNREELLKEICSSEYIIATRFHGTILGLTAGKSVFPIIYSDKTKYVLEDIGFQGSYADLRNPDSLSFENAKKNLESEYKIDVSNLVKDAEKHFQKLDKFLND